MLKIGNQQIFLDNLGFFLWLIKARWHKFSTYWNSIAYMDDRHHIVTHYLNILYWFLTFSKYCFLSQPMEKLSWYPFMTNVQKWSLQKHFTKMQNKKYFKLTLKIMHIFSCSNSTTPKLFPSLSNIPSLSRSANNGPQCYHSYKFFSPFSQETFFLDETSSPKGLIEGRTNLGYNCGITLIKLAIYTYLLHWTC